MDIKPFNGILEYLDEHEKFINGILELEEFISFLHVKLNFTNSLDFEEIIQRKFNFLQKQSDKGILEKSEIYELIKRVKDYCIACIDYENKQRQEFERMVKLRDVIDENADKKLSIIEKIKITFKAILFIWNPKKSYSNRVSDLSILLKDITNAQNKEIADNDVDHLKNVMCAMSEYDLR